MAYRLTMWKKKLLVSIHVISVATWFGSTLCMLLLGFYLKNADNGEQLYYTLSSMHLIDETLLKYPGLIALITGIMLSIWTQWGLMKHYWVVIKLFLTIGIIIFGIFYINEWFSFLIEKVNQFGFTSLQKEDFQTKWLSMIIGAAFNIIAMVIMTLVTYFKPFGKVRKKSRLKKQFS